jgi:hypothetical protein
MALGHAERAKDAEYISRFAASLSAAEADVARLDA